MKCPDCGAEMEVGFLIVPLQDGLRSMKWSKEPHHETLGQEVVYNPRNWQLWDQWQPPIFPSHRCTKCTNIVFNYGQEVHATPE